jgi:hypothetical protein
MKLSSSMSWTPSIVEVELLPNPFLRDLRSLVSSRDERHDCAALSAPGIDLIRASSYFSSQVCCRFYPRWYQHPRPANRYYPRLGSPSVSQFGIIDSIRVWALPACPIWNCYCCWIRIVTISIWCGRITRWNWTKQLKEADAEVTEIPKNFGP